MSRRPAIVAAVAAGVAAALFAALLLVEFDASALGAAVLARAGAALGVQLTARSFRLRPLTGLVLEGVQGSASFTGGRAAVSLDRLVLDHRFWRLLLGEIVVDRLVLQGLHVQLAESAAPSPRVATQDVAGGAAASGLGRMALRVSRIDVQDGTIELQTPGAPRPVVLKGLDLRLRDVALDPSPGAALAGLAATGDVSVAEIALASTSIRDLRGSLRLGKGRLQTDTVRFHTDEGAFEAEVGADLNRLPLAYTLSLRGQPLDMARILGSPAAAGFGAGSLRVEVRGSGTTPDGVQGAGNFRLEAGALGATPLLKALDRALGRATLVGARYQRTGTPFRIEHGRVAFDRLLFQTDRVALQVGGWASLKGPLELSVSVRAPLRDLAVGGMGAGALALLTDPDGNVVVPFKVIGTQAAPKVLPDVGALAAQTRQGAARALLDKAGRGLGGLIPHKRRDER